MSDSRVVERRAEASASKNSGNANGGKKVSPDEFKIVSHSPLTMPPNAELRPPRPGEPRPQETTPSDQAKEALSPAMAGRVQAQAESRAGSKVGTTAEPK